MKFRVTDISGWQAGYAFDIVRGAPDATADTAPSRSAFLASMDSFTHEFDALAALPLTAGDKSDVATIRAAFAKFADMDRRAPHRGHQCTTNSAEIAATIATISSGAQTTTSGVIDIQAATQELSQMSNGLRVLVGQFRV